jgi:putative flippase GtrA
VRKYLDPKLFWETFRYLLCGVTTVLVNIAAYRLLAAKFGVLAANTAAFFIAVFYAYFGNSLFVFHAKITWKSFLQFMAMRIGTLVIDDGGMLLMLSWGWGELFSKCAVNVIIIAINYLFSKLLIFKKDHTKENTE